MVVLELEAYMLVVLLWAGQHLMGAVCPFATLDGGKSQDSPVKLNVTYAAGRRSALLYTLRREGERGLGHLQMVQPPCFT